MAKRLEAITLAVIAGVLESTVRQMTLTLERTARSPIFKLGRDYSNAIFDSRCRMVVQGEDLPIHLGSMLLATKKVAQYFGEDIREGDVYYHNDPESGGGHLQDQCMLKPVFFDGECVFWVANKAHMDDTGGVVAGGYNPHAEEIYAEGMRIPPLRIHDSGMPRGDVIDMLVANVRTQRQQRNDMAAQLAALTVAERNLLELCDRYEPDVVRAACDRILDIGEENMRRAIEPLPDGMYEGAAIVEDDGRWGELRITTSIEIHGDEMKVAVTSPPQVPGYINSYWANTISEIYFSVLTCARPPLPYNEGLYRPISIDLGPAGTLTNASHPAACSATTGTCGENIADSVRDALSKAAPHRAVAGWAHPAGTNQIGTSPETGSPYTFNMIIGTSGGAGASWGIDGWSCLGPSGCGGGMMTGDVELLELEHPVQIHRFELRPDSGGAGRWRGGLGSVFEEEPIDHEATLVLRGEGFTYPSISMLGARSALIEPKLVRKYLLENGMRTELPRAGLVPIRPGQILQTNPAGGGGIGDPFERDAQAVLEDVRNGLVTVDGARRDYGCALDAEELTLDSRETARLRGRG